MNRYRSYVQTTILVRITSSVVVVSLLLSFFYLWGQQGVLYLGTLFAFFAIIEFQKMILGPLGRFLQTLFVIFATLLLLSTYTQKVHPTLPLGIWGTGLALFISMTLWRLKNKFSNQELLSTLALSLLGFFYCSLLPASALYLLTLPTGLFWFFSLLIIILSGDTMAYLGGRLWGQRKLHDQISPKKTVEGAFCGTLGSVVIAGVLWVWPLMGKPSDMSLVFFLAVAFMGSLLAQCGDLFESLIKRVGNVKDSGNIIPGHGGILDRIDGLLFAAPIFLAAATLYT